MGELLPVASDNQKGLLSQEYFKSLSMLSMMTGNSYFDLWLRIGIFEADFYRPIRLEYYIGTNNLPNTKKTLGFVYNAQGVDGILGDTGENEIGYIKEGDRLSLYVYVQRWSSFLGFLIGGKIYDATHPYVKTEPSGIVYF